MSEEAIRIVELGITGIVVTIVAFLLGMFRVEFLGVVFSVTTLVGQGVVACLEQFGGADATAEVGAGVGPGHRGSRAE